MDRFYRRIIVSFLFIIASLSVLIGRLVDTQYAVANAEKQLQELESQTQLIESQLESRGVTDTMDLIELIRPIAQSISPRVTLFDSQGQLVYDSMETENFPATSQEISLFTRNFYIEFFCCLGVLIVKDLIRKSRESPFAQCHEPHRSLKLAQPDGRAY